MRSAPHRVVLGLVLVATGLALAARPTARWAVDVYTEFRSEAIWLDIRSGRTAGGPDDPVARLTIPQVNLALNVLDGATLDHLAVSPAFESTSPGVILAHREKDFNPLKKLQVGATVELETMTDRREYIVRDIEIHTPESLERRIAAPGVSGDTLFLVTCHPFRWLGPAPNRFVAVCGPI